MLTTPQAKITTALVCFFSCVSVVLLQFSPMTLDRSGVVTALTAIVMMAALYMVMAVVNTRLKNDSSSVAGYLRYFATTIQNISWASGMIMCVTSLMIILNYIGLATSLPFQDATFSSIDKAMGFDWIATLTWVNERPMIAKILTMTYHASVMQMVAVALILGFTNQLRHLQEFTALFAMTSLPVLVISALLPAEGAYAFYQPAETLFSNMSEVAGRWHMEQLASLRAGTFHVLDIKHAEGLVTFPSFHTILAIITAYAFRDTRYLAVPFAVLNAIVIASTLPEGGHFLIDVIAGGLIALAAIALVRRCQNVEVASESLSLRWFEWLTLGPTRQPAN